MAILPKTKRDILSRGIGEINFSTNEVTFRFDDVDEEWALPKSFFTYSQNNEPSPAREGETWLNEERQELYIYRNSAWEFFTITDNDSVFKQFFEFDINGDIQPSEPVANVDDNLFEEDINLDLEETAIEANTGQWDSNSTEITPRVVF